MGLDSAPSFAARRARVAAAMREAGGGIAIVPTAPERPRNGDSDHPFRHGSDFHYLTGFDEPGAWLLIGSDGRTTLVCRPKDVERELWDGIRLGPEAAPAALGVDEGFPLDRLDELLVERLAGAPAVWWIFETPAPRRAHRRLARARARQEPARHRGTRRAARPGAAARGDARQEGRGRGRRRCGAPPASAPPRMRARCAFARAASPRRPARASPNTRSRPSCCTSSAAPAPPGPAYTSIVAAGANACILHYSAGATPLRAGELCLIDAGCELDGYASDVTRTFPASGRFSAAQRELYDLVQAAQAAAVAATRPGARLREAHAAAVRVLAQGMLDTGLLDRDAVGDVDAVIESAAYRKFYMHGTGHWLGRDVHDVGDYQSSDEAPVEQPDWLGGRVVKKPSRKLEPGMVVTIEPGLYVRPGERVPERFWNLGIRIEDDAVVTATGCELISRGVPVDAAEIEALMAS